MSESKVLITNFSNLKTVLLAAKELKSEVVIIPKVFMQSTFMNSIMGCSYNSIIAASSFEQLQPMYIWDENSSINYISLYTKDINPWFKILNDNNIELEYVYIRYIEYDINNNKIGMAYSIEFELDKQPISLPLIEPYTKFTNTIELMNFYINNSKNCGVIDLSSNKEFLNIMNSKASEGAYKVNLEDKNKKLWTVYLSKNMINYSNKDSIFVNIRTNISNRPINEFITTYSIIKSKKHLTLTYSMLNLNINNY